MIRDIRYVPWSIEIRSRSDRSKRSTFSTLMISARAGSTGDNIIYGRLILTTNIPSVENTGI